MVFFIKDHLVREIEMTNRSLKKGFSTWESVCKEIKIKELQDEVTVKKNENFN